VGEAPGPDRGSLAGHLERWVERTPDETVLIDGDLSLSWQDLHGLAWRTAAALRSLGVARGDRVAIQLPNWHEFAVVYLAAARIGAIVVPIMPVYRHNEMQHMLALTEPKVLVVPSMFRGFDHLALGRRLAGEHASVGHLVVVRPDDPAALGPAETALADVTSGSGVPANAELGAVPPADGGHVIGFTSGTEAKAKGCFHTWSTYSYSPRVQAWLYAFGPDDCELTPSPITHTAGLAGAFLKALLAGGRVCLMESWDPAAALRLIDRHRCTQATGATPFIAGLVDAYDPAAHDASSLRVFVCGGAPVSEELVRRARQTLPGCRVLPCFGQTEGLIVTTCRPDDPPERLSTSDGRAAPGVDVEVRGEDGVRLQLGSVGSLVYRGPGNMLRYWRDPEATVASLTPDGWRITGDLARMDADGYVRVTGRLKDVIIRGGLNISSREVEDLLAQHPAVAQVAVVGYPDDRLGERACAFVVPAGQPPTLAELVRYLLDEHGLAKPKLPERLRIVEGLPMTTTGKIQKFALRELARADADT
jgi:acyl-CoA synthetase (AMP-forming)/AMP-acid ligase II